MEKIIELLSIPERWEISVSEDTVDEKMEVLRKTDPSTSRLYYAVKVQAKTIKSAEPLVINAQKLLKLERAVGFIMGPPEESVELVHFIVSGVEPLSYSRACGIARFMRIFEQLDFVYQMAFAAVIFSLDFDRDNEKAYKIGDAVLRESGYEPIFLEKEPG